MKIRLMFLLVLFGCSEVEDRFEYPQEVSQYVETFQQEAKTRGVPIEYDGLEIIAATELPEPYAAYYKPKEHRIYIDIDSEIWRKFPEETIAHEMGHAVMKRYEHDFSRLSNGMYKSIMGNYSSPFYGGWTSHDSINYRKDYYYDELFNPNVNEPNWAK